MHISKLARIVFAAGALTAFAGSPTLAGAVTVNVSLWDKGDTSLDKINEVKPMGMAMKGGDKSAATLGIKLDKAEVPAGEVTFRVTNDSKSMIHEMVLSPVADQSVPLPYMNDADKADEDAAGHLGEVAELEPGQSGALTIAMKPGTYILYCNIPGHYKMGMWAMVTVK